MKITAIVIKISPTNEYDQLITLYTHEQGKIQAVAKSSLKTTSRQALHLAEGNLIECEFVESRGLPIITGAQAIRTFPVIRQSLKKMAALYLFLEVVDKTIFEHEVDAKLWKFLSNLLTDLETVSEIDLTQWLENKKSDLLIILGYSIDKNQRYFFERLAGQRLAAFGLLNSVNKMIE